MPIDARPAVLFLVGEMYPPRISPGSLRMARMTAHLPQHGWRALVLAAGTSAEAKTMLDMPQAEGLELVRTARIDPVKALFLRTHAGGSSPARGGFGSRTGAWARSFYRDAAFPDRDWTWHPVALRAARRLIEDPAHDIRAVFTSSPTVSPHRVALALRQRYGIPWIAEFRDPWAHSRVRAPRSRLRGGLERRLERRICQGADRLVSVSAEYLAAICQANDVPSERTAVIYNGFDPADFAGLDVAPHPETFTLAHAGSLYGGSRDPGLVFRALRSLAADGRIDPARLRIDLYGPPEPEIDRELDRLDLPGVVRWHGSIPYRDLPRRLAETYALLLLTHATERTLPSKLFDYVGSGRPVVAACEPGSELQQIVEGLGAGNCVAHGDLAGMREALARLWEAWTRGESSARSYDARRIAPYTRNEQARQLAGLLDGLVERQPSGPYAEAAAAV